MTKMVVAQDVAGHLLEAEADVDRTLVSTARLLERTVLARKQLNLSTVVGGSSVQEITGALASLGDAHHRLVAAHRRLGAVQKHIGLETVSWGEDKEVLAAPADTATTLKVVAR